MSQKEKGLDEVLGRAVRDGEFRSQLLKDPDAALKSYSLSSDDIAVVAAGVQSEAAEEFFEQVASDRCNLFCTHKGCADN